MKRTGLQRRSRIRRSRGLRRVDPTRAAINGGWGGLDRQFFREQVTAHPCLMCVAGYAVPEGIARGRTEAHHVIPKQTLRREAPDRLWDVTNGIALCAYHHQQHEVAALRVPLELLPRRVIDFACLHRLYHHLERIYPRGAPCQSPTL